MKSETDTLKRPAAKPGRQPKSGPDLEREMYEDIHRAIAEKRLPPGTKLTEEQIAEAYGVSRSRTRAVLQKLAGDKVVTLERNRGAFVSRPTPAEARNVFEARKLLEPAIARRLAGKIAPEGIARLRLHVEREEAAEHGDDRHDELRTSHDFHLMLAEFLANPEINAFLGELTARSTLITAIYERLDASTCSHVSHAHLIDLIEAGDGDALERAMRDHLTEIEAQLVLEEFKPRTVDLKSALRAGRPGRKSRSGL